MTLFRATVAAFSLIAILAIVVGFVALAITGIRREKRDRLHPLRDEQGTSDAAEE